MLDGHARESPGGAAAEDRLLVQAFAGDQAGAQALGRVRLPAQLHLVDVHGLRRGQAAGPAQGRPIEAAAIPPGGIATGQMAGGLIGPGIALAELVPGVEHPLAPRRPQIEELPLPGIGLEVPQLLIGLDFIQAAQQGQDIVQFATSHYHPPRL